VGKARQLNYSAANWSLSTKIRPPRVERHRPSARGQPYGSHRYPLHAREIAEIIDNNAANFAVRPPDAHAARTFTALGCRRYRQLSR